MLRGIALVGSGALALSAVIITPATVKAAVTGNVTCNLTGGSIAITPGLMLTSPGSATKTVPITFTLSGTLSGCTGAQSGTKGGAQIDGGTVAGVAKIKIKKGGDIPGCLDLVNSPFMLKTKVTFTHGGAKLTNSVATLTLAGVDSSGANVMFNIAGPVSGGAAFKGQTVTTAAILTGSAGDLQSACGGGASTKFNFTNASTLVIP